MRRVINSYISKLKGEAYQLDVNVPLKYLFRLCVQRGIMAIYGACLPIHKKGLMFVSLNTKIKCLSKIFAGRGCTIASGCYIDALSIEGIILGNNVSIGKNTVVECSGSLSSLGKGLKIGENVGLGSHGFWGCAGGVAVGDDTIFGNYVSLHSENHIFNNLDIPIRLQGVNRMGIVIGKNCWIGAKVTILDGVFIEDGCVFAAGSVVASGRYLKNGVYGGVPARFLKYRVAK